MKRGMLSSGVIIVGMLVLGRWAQAEPGDPDPDFAPEVSWPAASGTGTAVRDSQGRWVVSDGTSVERLLQDGRRDPAFAREIRVDGSIYALAIGPNDSIYVGGTFTNLVGRQTPHLGRLTAEGSPDATWPAPSLAPLGIAASVLALAVQTDGKVVVGGAFAQWNGQRAPSVTRLSPDGTVDVDFTANLRPAFGGTTNTLITVTNVGGQQVTVTNVTVSYENLSQMGSISAVGLRATGEVLFSGVVMAELRPDGTPLGVRSSGNIAWTILSEDELLTAEVPGSLPAVQELRLQRVRPRESWKILQQFTLPIDGWVSTVTTGADGNWVLGGNFTVVDGHRREGVVRLHPDGGVDPTFAATLHRTLSPVPWELRDWAEPRAEVATLVPDGTAWVAAGRFDRAAGRPVPGLVRMAGGQRTASPPEIGPMPERIQAQEGDGVRLGGVIRGPADLEVRWTRNGSTEERGTEPVLDLGRVRLGDAGIYQVAARERNGVIRSEIIQLDVTLGSTSPGSVDGTFVSGPVRDEGLGALGRISDVVGAGTHFYVLGEFTHYASHSTPRVARLTIDGAVDTRFEFLRGDERRERLTDIVQAAVLADGRLLVEIRTRSESGLTLSELVALTPNGSVDSGFRALVAPGTTGGRFGPMVVLANGTILVARRLFTPGPELVALRPDGSVDAAFSPELPSDFLVEALVAHQTGVVVIGRNSGPSTAPVVKRLDGSGGLDAAFRPNLTGWSGVTAVVPDGASRVLVVPASSPPGQLPPLLRWDPQGVLDESFRFDLGPGGPAGVQVQEVAVQRDGRIVLRLSASPVLNPELDGVVRLRDDGFRDADFDFQPRNQLSSLGGLWVTPEDWILVPGTGRHTLRRLHARDERLLTDPRRLGERFSTSVQTKIGRRYVLEAMEPGQSGGWREVGSLLGDDRQQSFQLPAGANSLFRTRIEDAP